MTEPALREAPESTGAGIETLPPDGSAQAPDGTGQAEEEKVPWHNDPRFIKFNEDRKRVAEQEAELEEEKARIQEGKLRAEEDKRLEDIDTGIPIPEEMPIPETAELLEAGYTEEQIRLLHRTMEATVHNDRRNMAISFDKSKRRDLQQQTQNTREVREAMLLAERNFGRGEFGSMGDPRSELRQRVEMILRGKQLTSLNVYDAAVQANNELAEKKRLSEKATTGGEEMVSGRQTTGASLPTARAGFKSATPAQYAKMTREQQVAHDRASIGLPPEE